ncbi:gp40 [Stenotrophomonas phage S1]|uniref:hypothetical protein n=1 Tax=Stenotrophomonas phage S1 TaxID=573591 RepID=UPI000185A07C|nr:hypothetical protein StPS1_gp40 [Stenotrophomonas phage S1]ACJ24765.1 gp40 [Stenotrophomonas phage S1]
MAGTTQRHGIGERARGLAHGQPLTEVLIAQRALAASRSAFAWWISAIRSGTTTAATSATAAQARRRCRLMRHPLSHEREHACSEGTSLAGIRTRSSRQSGGQAARHRVPCLWLR